MKIARIEVDGETRVGVVDGDRVQPLTAAVEDVLAATPDERAELVARTALGEPRPLSTVRLLAPVQPGTLRDYITFEEHLEGSLKLLGRTAPPPEWYDQPVFYFSNSNAVIGPDEPVAVPPGCRMLDFELELAAVIGRPGTDLTPERAGEHIAGYTLFNDWSARDLMPPVIPVGLGPVKGKDFANTLGPWIVTADELAPHRRADRLALEMHAEVNGVPLAGGGDTSAHMAWSFEEIVAYASRGTELPDRRRARLGDLRRGLPARVLGAPGRRRPAVPAAGRRRDPGRRGDRLGVEPGRRGRRAGGPAEGPGGADAATAPVDERPNLVADGR